MPSYFDSSALVPLVIDEPGTAVCTRAWEQTDLAISSEIALVEVHAALAHAIRLNRLDAEAHARAVASFSALWGDVLHVPVTGDLIDRAAQFALSQALRGYDALHCATALATASGNFVAVAGDHDLLRAWHSLGIATVDTSS